MKLLGFNAIRMPFSMQDLYYATPRDFQWQYCTNVDDATFIASVTNPNVPPPKSALCSWTLLLTLTCKYSCLLVPAPGTPNVYTATSHSKSPASQLCCTCFTAVV